MSFSSDEVNYLVYRYLLESGNAYSFLLPYLLCEVMKSVSVCLLTFFVQTLPNFQCMLPVAMTCLSSGNNVIYTRGQNCGHT